MNNAFFILYMLSAISLFTPVFSGYVLGLAFLALKALSKTRKDAVIIKESPIFDQEILPIFRAVVIFWIVLLVTGFLSSNISRQTNAYDTFRALGHYCIKFLVIWYVYKRFVVDMIFQGKYWKTFALTYGLCSLIHLVYCVIQRAYGVDWVHGFDAMLGGNRFAYGVYRISGFVGHPLTLGYCQVLAFVASSYLLKETRDRWERFAWSSSIICSATVILLSGSRGPQLALFAGALVLILNQALYKRWKWMAAAGCVVLAVGFKVGVFDRFFEIFQNGFGGDERLLHWKAHWRIFMDYPWLGIGASPRKSAISAYYFSLGGNDNIMLAHNAFLQIMANFGVVGLMGVCFWVASLWKVALAANSGKRALLALNVTMLSGGLIQNNLQDSEFALAFAFWFLTIKAIEVRRRNESRESASQNNFA